MVNRELKIMGIIVAVLVVVAIAWTLIGMKYGLGVSRNQGDDQTEAIMRCDFRQRPRLAY